MKKFLQVIFLSLFFSLQCAEISQKEIEEFSHLNPQALYYLQTKSPVFINKAALIFLDDSEVQQNALGASSIDLITAILQDAGPIIVSRSLLNNIMDIPESFLSYIKQLSPSQKIAEFHQEIARRKMLNIPPERLFESEIKYRINFETDIQRRLLDLHWFIKIINDDLLLLLPEKSIKYLHGFNFEDIKHNPSLNRNFCTKVELEFGFKVNHMPDITPNKIVSTKKNWQFADYFINSLDNIFVKKSDYYTARENYIEYDDRPVWSIYISGHGGKLNSIVGLSIKQFQEFLTFLETQVITKLLIYSSCYAAGTNSDFIYLDLKKGINKTYSYAIITQALTDSYVTTTTLDLQLINGTYGDYVKVLTYVNFNKFLEDLIWNRDVDYETIMSNIISKGAIGIHNTPQIKLPGIPWFNVLNSNNEIVSIGSIMAKTRIKPLDISTFFAKKGKKAEPRGILLYAKDIPFEIILDQKIQPTFVSMEPQHMHHIKKITFKNYFPSITQFGELFPIYGLNSYQFFLIDTISTGFWKYKNVVVELKKEMGILYYATKQGMFKSTFTKDSSTEPIALDEQEIKKYQSLLNLFKPFPNFFQFSELNQGIESLSSKQALTPEKILALKNILEKRIKKQ